MTKIFCFYNHRQITRLNRKRLKVTRGSVCWSNDIQRPTAILSAPAFRTSHLLYGCLMDIQLSLIASGFISLSVTVCLTYMENLNPFSFAPRCVFVSFVAVQNNGGCSNTPCKRPGTFNRLTCSASWSRQQHRRDENISRKAIGGIRA